MCCLAACGRCGGEGCSKLTGSARDCCISDITEHGSSCSDTNGAPCIIAAGKREYTIVSTRSCLLRQWSITALQYHCICTLCEC